jgi:hypothetical protein
MVEKTLKEMRDEIEDLLFEFRVSPGDIMKKIDEYAQAWYEGNHAFDCDDCPSKCSGEYEPIRDEGND